MNTIAQVPTRVQWGLGGPVRLLASGNRSPSCSTLLTVQEDPRVAGRGTGLPSPQCLTLKLTPPQTVRSAARAAGKVQNAPARRVASLPGALRPGKCLGNDRYNYCLLYSFSHWKPRTQNPFPAKSRGSLVLLGPGAGRAASPGGSHLLPQPPSLLKCTLHFSFPFRQNSLDRIAVLTEWPKPPRFSSVWGLTSSKRQDGSWSGKNQVSKRH